MSSSNEILTLLEERSRLLVDEYSEFSNTEDADPIIEATLLSKIELLDNLISEVHLIIKTDD